jgi:hypothetical protein
VADARPIIFGTGDKLAQLEAVAVHPDATSLDSQVSIMVSSRINKHTGDAVVGQAWIAKEISCAERSVRGSAARMHRLRLWDVTSGGGRGLANRWKPIARKPGNQQPGLAEKPGKRQPGIEPETRQIATLNSANYDTKPGTQLPPLPKYPLNSSLGGFDTAAETNVYAAEKWKSVKARAAKLLGADLTASWLGQLTVSTITEVEVVLIAPNRWMRQKIENDFLPNPLTWAWRAELPTITRVRIVDATARAAE